MKKITLLLLFISIIAFGQEKQEEFPQDINKKHEVKVNALSLLVFEWFDFSYEYLIDRESSIGAATLISFNNDDILSEYRTFSFTPYYRRYFSQKFARGFFVEGFGMVHSYERDILNNQEKKTDFGMGISIGGKFISKKGFTTEIYLGIGRNFANGNNSAEAVGRGGISLGYRF